MEHSEWTHVDLDCITLAKAPHVPLGKEAVREQREQYEFRKSQEFVPGEDEPGTPIARVSALNRRVDASWKQTGGPL